LAVFLQQQQAYPQQQQTHSSPFFYFSSSLNVISEEIDEPAKGIKILSNLS